MRKITIKILSPENSRYFFKAYYAGVLAGDLRLATKTGSVWTNERPDPGYNSEGAHASIAIDRTGKPHLSYLGGVDFSVKVARLDHSLFVPRVRK